MSQRRNKKDKEGEKQTPSGVLFPSELILFIKEFEKLMNQLIANPEIVSHGSEPRLFSFNITLGADGKPVVKPLVPSAQEVAKNGSSESGEDTDVIVEGNEVTVVTRLSPRIKEARVEASGREMHVLVDRDEVLTIRLPVKVEKKIEQTRLRNGVLTTKLRKKKILHN